MTDEELQSKSIDFLRFPLIVGVVLIHAHFSNVIMNGVNVNILHEYSCPIYDTTSYFFSELIGRIAVPLFFFISGFLFFYRSKEFSLSVYRIKESWTLYLAPLLILEPNDYFIFHSHTNDSGTFVKYQSVNGYVFIDWLVRCFLEHKWRMSYLLSILVFTRFNSYDTFFPVDIYTCEILPLV